jgi:hypothetical protein
MKPAIIFLSTILFTGCVPEYDFSRYESSCSVDDDCTLKGSGPCSACPGIGVSHEVSDQIDADYAGAWCPVPESEFSCSYVGVRCASGLCEAFVPTFDGGETSEGEGEADGQ